MEKRSDCGDNSFFNLFRSPDDMATVIWLDLFAQFGQTAEFFQILDSEMTAFGGNDA